MHAGVRVCLCSVILTHVCPLTLTLLTTESPTRPDLAVYNSSQQMLITSNLSFPYTLTDTNVFTLEFNYSFLQDATDTLPEEGWTIFASLNPDNIARIEGQTEFHIAADRASGNISVTLKGLLPGRAVLYFHGQDRVNRSQVLGAHASASDIERYGQSWRLYVERVSMPIDTAFNVIIILLVVLANIGMGAKVDLDVVKSQLKKPIAPIIGLFSQFVFMPLIAFAVVYTIEMDPGIALGLFALGCSPGGSASNAYTFLLDGNISLSVTMTLISTMASLGLLPMWLFSLGRVVYREANIKIPYENIFFSLLGIIVPVVVGLILQRKCPKVASYFVRSVKYIMIMFIIFVLTVGVYANLFIFSLMSREVLLASALVPYIGFILGGLAAFIWRQDLANIITIAVETGIQNTGIPIVLLRMSLNGPDKDTSIVAPVASAIFTPIPLIFGILFVQTRKYIRARKAASHSTEGKSGQNYNVQGKESVDFLLEAGDGDLRSRE